MRSVRSIPSALVAGFLAGVLALAGLAGGCRGTSAQAAQPPAVPVSNDRALEVGSGGPRAAPEARPAQDPPEAPPAARFDAPAGWESLTNLAFERAIDGWLPEGESRHVSETTLADLRRALGGPEVTAVRAAVMLARTRDPRAGEVLLERLEERVSTPPSESRRDAVDVVAAAAFAGGMRARAEAARLNSLAIGRKPHPSLAVRAECARSALALGMDTPIPYLVSVLRLGTTAGRVASSEENQDDLAWAQLRAAEALASRAGTESRYLPEGSVKDREEEASRLEALLPRPKPRD
ncbi:MAG: hypothetical protein ACKVXR_07220 [Planctomycetota bacterium]